MPRPIPGQLAFGDDFLREFVLPSPHAFWGNSPSGECYCSDCNGPDDA